MKGYTGTYMYPAELAGQVENVCSYDIYSY